jgi:hypothetical protein
LTGTDNTGIILLDTRPVHGTYPFPQWPASQFVIDEVNPQIPLSLEAGTYRLELSVLAGQGERIFATGLGPVTVVTGERAFARPSLANPISASFAGEISLVGYELLPVGANRYSLTLAWQAIGHPAGDYAAVVRLLAADETCCLWQEERMLESSAPPRQRAGYLTSRWLPGEVVSETYTIILPPETQPGTYSLAVALQQPEGGRPLQATVPGLPAADAVFLRPLQVKP